MRLDWHGIERAGSGKLSRSGAASIDSVRTPRYFSKTTATNSPENVTADTILLKVERSYFAISSLLYLQTCALFGATQNSVY